MACRADEIKEIARGLIERFGADALRQAELRIAELTANEQDEAVKLWRKIEQAIKGMQ